MSDVAIAHNSKKIACASFDNNTQKRGLLVSNLDGTQVKMISVEESSEAALSWSPDDLMIIYVCPEHYQSGGFDMYSLCVAMSDGSSSWKLQSNPQSWYSSSDIAW